MIKYNVKNTNFSLNDRYIKTFISVTSEMIFKNFYHILLVKLYKNADLFTQIDKRKQQKNGSICNTKRKTFLVTLNATLGPKVL